MSCELRTESAQTVRPFPGRASGPPVDPLRPAPRPSRESLQGEEEIRRAAGAWREAIKIKRAQSRAQEVEIGPSRQAEATTTTRAKRAASAKKATQEQEQGPRTARATPTVSDLEPINPPAAPFARPIVWPQSRSARRHLLLVAAAAACRASRPSRLGKPFRLAGLGSSQLARRRRPAAHFDDSADDWGRLLTAARAYKWPRHVFDLPQCVWPDKTEQRPLVAPASGATWPVRGRQRNYATANFAPHSLGGRLDLGRLRAPSRPHLGAPSGQFARSVSPPEAWESNKLARAAGALAGHLLLDFGDSLGAFEKAAAQMRRGISSPADQPAGRPIDRPADLLNPNRPVSVRRRLGRRRPLAGRERAGHLSGFGSRLRSAARGRAPATCCGSPRPARKSNKSLASGRGRPLAECRNCGQWASLFLISARRLRDPATLRQPARQSVSAMGWG